MKYICTILIAILVISIPSYATTYYLADAANPNAASETIGWGGLPSDSNSGTSWDNAWASFTNVNDITKFTHGDTLIMGSGIYRDVLNVVCGTNVDRTCYIDSMAFSGNYSGRVAWIYGSVGITDWTQIGETDVYIATITPDTILDCMTLWQNDSMLWREADSALVDGVSILSWSTVQSSPLIVDTIWDTLSADWWYGNGHIIAQLATADDPDGYEMELTQRKGVETQRPWTGQPNQGGQDCVSLVGFGIKNVYGHAISGSASGMPMQGWDTCIYSHLYLSNCATWLGYNASLIYNGRSGEGGWTDPYVNGDSIDGYDYNRIVGCSLGVTIGLGNAYVGGAVNIPHRPTTINTDAINLYGYNFGTIDSNVFFGHQSENGIYFKVYRAGDDSVGACHYNDICFNQFLSTAPNGIQMYAGIHHCNFYGNIFNGPTARGIRIKYSSAGSDSSGYNLFYNNTFYDCYILQSDEEGSGYLFPHRHNESKYNVFYFTTGGNAYNLDTVTFWDNIDSNIYYAASGSNTWDGRNWASWQDTGFDANSSENTDPGFTDAASGDFTRSGASGEMSIDYDGWVATIYGAIQNEEESEEDIDSLNIENLNIKNINIGDILNESIKDFIDYFYSSYWWVCTKCAITN